MAETSGLVQQLTIASDTVACVWIGPTPNNTELLLVTNDNSPADTAFAANLIQTLAAASTNYRAIAAQHGDSEAKITSVRVDPV
ncbi:hypothetical protein [Nocardia amamiensis]|uniref:hypothetical protein n=1 Tax=Nocardia amamiensis TaxID=404578 RepID=UPI0033F2C837